jgi:gliding motility-associated-like protein
MKTCRILLLLLIFPLIIKAQQESIWVFSQNVKLDFTNPTTPIASTFNTSSGGVIPTEANACVGNNNGELLFFTEGSYIKNRNQNVMPNGSGIVPFANYSPVMSATSSCSQGALIVLNPSNPNQYYVFSLTSYEYGNNSGSLYYSLVDMSLDNGLGDIVAGQKGIPLGNNYTEHMISIGSPCSKVWVVLLSRNHAAHAYAVTENGVVSTPIVSPFVNLTIPTEYYKSVGCMAAATNNLAIAAGIHSRGVALFDFDPMAGIISNTRIVDTNTTYGVCFSPDNTKLYGASNGINQYNLSAGSLSQIINSKTIVSSVGVITTNFKLAPDHKIYLKGINTNPLAVINNPNGVGIAAQVTTPPFLLNPNTGTLAGFPNNIIIPRKDTIINQFQLNLCGALATISATSSNENNYSWNDGSTSNTLTIAASGKYWVSYYNACFYYIDTFDVVYNRYAYHDVEATICPGATYTFNGKAIAGEGVYIDTLFASGSCDSIITLHLKKYPSHNIALSILNDNGRWCRDDSALVFANYLGLEHQWWVNGAFISNHDSVRVALLQNNNHILLKTKDSVGCALEKFIDIEAAVCCTVYVPNAFSPNQDGLNDQLQIYASNPLTEYELLIQNRWGQTVYASQNIHEFWDGYYKSEMAPVGTYFYVIQGKCADGSKYKKKGDVILVR